MLRSSKELIGYHMEASDGEIGKARDFFFDDQEWTVRHLVADTRKWLPGRKVLISPQALGEPDREEKVFHVDLTCDQIRHSPSIDTDKPVSRQHQIELYEYYSWTPYWGAGMVGPFPEPGVVTDVPEAAELPKEHAETIHIRSMKELTGYHIFSGDKNVGRVKDFIVEDHSWIVRYVVGGMHDHFSSKKIVISPAWITGIEWSEKRIDTDLKVNDILNAPAFDHKQPIERRYEERLYDHYERPKYWGE